LADRNQVKGSAAAADRLKDMHTDLRRARRPCRRGGYDRRGTTLAVAMKCNSLAGLLLLFVALAPAAERGQPPLVPLVFVHGEDEATTRKVIREVAEGGNTGFVWESRPHPDYLGPRWWSDLAIAIDEAKKHNLEVWIFDEWMYPSGIAGG